MEREREGEKEERGNVEENRGTRKTKNIRAQKFKLALQKKAFLPSRIESIQFESQLATTTSLPPVSSSPILYNCNVDLLQYDESSFFSCQIYILYSPLSAVARRSQNLDLFLVCFSHLRLHRTRSFNIRSFIVLAIRDLL